MSEAVVNDCTHHMADLMASMEPPGKRYATTAFDNQLAGRVRFLVATIGREPVGSCEVTAEDRPRVLNLNVRPEWRGRGIGSLLIENAEAAASSRGELAIWVAEDNSRALKMYLRLGFQPTGRTETSTYEAVDDDGLKEAITEVDCELLKPLPATPGRS